MASTENQYRVRLIPVSVLSSGADTSTIRLSQVNFDATPAVSESRTVEYVSSSPVHMPGSVLMYKRTNGRTFSLTAHFISRNASDAAKNMQRLQLLRSWTMPYFGQTTTNASPTEKQTQSRVAGSGYELRGAPPDVLYFYAYASSTPDSSSDLALTNLARIPVVLTSLDITYPDDVDYIPTSVSVLKPNGSISSTDAVPFPVKMDVGMTLMETHSPTEYQSFDLLKYKSGTLVGF